MHLVIFVPEGQQDLMETETQSHGDCMFSLQLELYSLWECSAGHMPFFYKSLSFWDMVSKTVT